jgi:hypothetical protein
MTNMTIRADIYYVDLYDMISRNSIMETEQHKGQPYQRVDYNKPGGGNATWNTCTDEGGCAGPRGKVEYGLCRVIAPH